MSDIRLGITFFSLGHPFAQHRLDLEGCLALSKECGFEGIELVSAQMVPNFPTPDENWCKQFVRMMDRYGLEGFAYGSYVDMTRFHGRNMTEEEIFQTALLDLKTADRLGMKCLKTQCSMPVPVIRRLAPIAKGLGIWLGFELHAPNHMRDRVWEPLFRLFDEYGPDIMGVVPDTGIFASNPSRPLLNEMAEQGMDPLRLERMAQAHADGLTLEQAKKEMGRMDAREEQVLESFYRDFDPVPMSDFDLMLPYSRYMHGKYFYINEDNVEPTVDFEQLVAHMKQAGYHGAVAAEYEGYFHDISIDSVEQVRRYAEMMRKLI